MLIDMEEHDLEEFKRRYPHLAKELIDGVGVRKLSELLESDEPPLIPTAVDYLRRCNSIAEALEVLDYLTRTGQLEEEERKELEDKIVNEGLESLGPRKSFGYYSERYLKDIDLRRLQRALP